MRADPALAEESRAVVLDEELRKLPEPVRRVLRSFAEPRAAAGIHRFSERLTTR